MRLLLALAAGIGTAVVVTIVLTLLDMYLAGHGLRSITGPLVDWPGLGVHLSLADVVMLVAALLAAVIAWHRTARTGR